MDAQNGRAGEPESGAPFRVHTVRGLFWSGLQRTGGQAIGLATFIVLSRLLPPSDFGVLALANVYLLVVLLLVEQGVNQAVIQRHSLSPEHLDAAFSVSLGLATVLTLLTLVLAAPLSRLFDEPTLEPVLRWLSLTVLLSGLRATQTAVLQRQMRFRELAVRTTFAEGLGGVVGIAMALGGLGVWSLVGQAIARALAGVFVLWRVSVWRPHLRVALGPVREVTRFGLPVLGDRLVALVQGKADDLVIGLVLGATALGYYAVGYRMLTYATMLLAGTFQAVSLPVLSRLQHDLPRFRHTFLTMVHYLALAAFPVFVGIAFVAPEIVPVLFGPNWSPSIPVMQVLALVGAAKVLPLATATALVAQGRPGVQLRLNLVTTALAVIGFVSVVGRGIVAVASVHLIVALLAIPLHAGLLHSVFDIRPSVYFRAIRTAGVGVVLMGAVLLPLTTVWSRPQASLLWLVVAIVVGAATYLGATYLLGRSSYDRARRALQEGILAGPGAVATDPEPEGLARPSP